MPGNDTDDTLELEEIFEEQASADALRLEAAKSFIESIGRFSDYFSDQTEDTEGEDVYRQTSLLDNRIAGLSPLDEEEYMYDEVTGKMAPVPKSQLS